jgi:hypothetical protein
MQPTTDSILWMSGTPATAAMAPTTRTVSKWATTPVMAATTAATASRSPVPHEVLQDDLFVHEDAVTRSSSTTFGVKTVVKRFSYSYNDHTAHDVRDSASLYAWTKCLARPRPQPPIRRTFTSGNKVRKRLKTPPPRISLDGSEPRRQHYRGQKTRLHCFSNLASRKHRIQNKPKLVESCTNSIARTKNLQADAYFVFSFLKTSTF